LTLSKDKELSEEMGEDKPVDASVVTKLDIGHGRDFLYIRMGQLVEKGKDGSTNHFLHGVGRRIKLKPIWVNDTPWTPEMGKEGKSIEECL